MLTESDPLTMSPTAAPDLATCLSPALARAAQLPVRFLLLGAPVHGFSDDGRQRQRIGRAGAIAGDYYERDAASDQRVCYHAAMPTI